MRHNTGIGAALCLFCAALCGITGPQAYAVSAMTVVDENTPMLYIEPLGDLPNSGAPAGWTATVYNTAPDNGKGDAHNGNHSGNWQSGVYGVGYGDADDFTLIDHADNSTLSVYTRSVFTVASAASIQAMTLEVNYDDGYVAWINGVEVARSASMASKATAWNTAAGDHENTAAPERIDISAFANQLVNGQNTLAIGIWNSSGTSSDMSLRPRLTLYDGPYVAPPVHTYLTWQGDPGTTMTVNYQTGDPVGTSVVHYDTVSHGGVLTAYPLTATGSAHQIPGLSAYVTRNIHWVQLTGLTPGQTYYFVAGDGTTAVSREMKFRTPPNGDSAIRFVVGGDMDVIQTVGMLHRQAARQNPMFAWMTGDLAIDNGALTSWARWDTWLSLWEENMITQDRYLVPMVLGIGNHEVNGGFGQSWDKAPFYFGYFAQDPTGYPPASPKAYFSRRFGDNLMLCVLDSGHVDAIAGAQTTWAQGELSAASAVPWRIAGYHVPMYPSDRSYTDTNILDVRNNWLSVVDQFQLAAVFEGHDHVEKRTKPLRNGNIDPAGTVFLGDGYGTQGLRPGEQAGAWYLERAESRYHLWLVDVPNSCAAGSSPTYTAIDENGTAFDTYRRKADAAASTTLVPTGSVWKYLDNGSDQGTAWFAAAFDDSTWASGPAELGYGDSPVTTVSYGSDANNKYITTYFRKTFDVANPSVYGNLQLRLKRDDGAVVYLNGAEVYRVNMAPTGTPAYNTLAATLVSGTDEEAFFLSPRLMNSLAAGSNTLAVEIHQQAVTSTDVSFDLELLAYSTASTVLSAKGATWKYLDNGTDQGTAWRVAGFNDTGWASGPAVLGYGEGNENTTVGYGPDGNNKYVTTYFRRQFTVADASKYRGYALRVMRDDGVVVYLNGVEIYRANMPAGSYSYTTFANYTVPSGWEERYFYPSAVMNNVLLSGTNTLAVEVHQVNATSSDISFDLELVGIAGLNAVTASAGSNGTVTPAGTTAVRDGNNQTYTVTPNSGYHVEDVLVDCASVGAVESHSFNGVTAPHTISATFAMNVYGITCNAIGNGTCAANPSTLNDGATSSITAVPQAGWYLERISDSVEGVRISSYTTTALHADRIITATFAEPYSVPDLTGMNPSDAGTVLGRAGLGVGSVTQHPSTTVPAGRVVGQSVNAHTTAAPNAPVDYVVSLGPPVSLTYNGDNPLAVATGGRVVLKVTPVNPHGTLRLQWYRILGTRPPELIDGATSDTLVIDGFTPELAANYVCSAMDDFDTVQSPEITLTVEKKAPVAGWVGISMLLVFILAGGVRILGRHRKSEI